ncbi:MAG: CPBP family intramembrane metalloprotease [Oscillospiraceae bacterium]|jgi:membrane protease YdiL (CAAX protease family)|nr:CPBP family intramembrane metalloprotease [Oscillospiraceae bacterium]
MKNLFINKYNELRSGWGLAILFLAYVIVSNIAAAAVAVVWGIAWVVTSGGSISTDDILYLMSDKNLLLIANLAGQLAGFFVPWLMFKLMYKKGFHSLGFVGKRWLGMFAAGLLLGAATFSLSYLIMYVTGSVRVTDFDFDVVLSPLFWLQFAAFGLGAGFVEEALCRGGMSTLLKTTRNKWAVIFIPSVIFGLLHLGNANVTIFSIANIVLVGVAFALLFIKTGSIWICVGMHLAWNVVQGLVFGINVSGNPALGILSSENTAGLEWLNGGGFGAEGGAAVSMVLAFTIVALLVIPIKRVEGGWSLEGDLPLLREKTDVNTSK